MLGIKAYLKQTFCVEIESHKAEVVQTSVTFSHKVSFVKLLWCHLHFQTLLFIRAGDEIFLSWFDVYLV